MQTHRTPARWIEHPQVDPWIHQAGARLGVEPPLPTDPVFASLKEALIRRDELADELAAWFKQNKDNTQIFDAFVAGGLAGLDTIPPVLARLERELLSQRPAWADRDRMIVGSNAHFRLGQLGRLASGTLGLLDGYRCAPVAKVLTMTGSLDSATAKRLDETSRFFSEVVLSEGMPRDSDGFRAAIKVRLVHSFVRHGLARSESWNAEEFGHPITIMDSLGTSMSFWVPVILAAPAFGYTVTRAEAEGMMTLWNYVGYLQGVPEALLPETLEETYRIYLGILMQIGEPNADSIKLARAYIGAAANRGGKSSWLNEKMVTGTAARLLPTDHRRELHVPNTLFRFWPDLLRPTIRRRDHECHEDPDAYAAAVGRGREIFARDLGSHDNAPTYDPASVVHDQTHLEAA